MGAAEKLLTALEATGLDRLLRPVFGGIGAIFTLHRVAAEGTPILDPDIVTSAAFLDAALTETRRMGFEIVSLDAMAARLQAGAAGGKKLVCFSFDDGYRDNLKIALPVFKAHGAPLAIYLTTGLIDRQLDYWWGALEQVVREQTQLNARALGLPANLPATTLAEKRAALATLQAWTHADLEGRVAPLRAWCAEQGASAAAALDADALNWAEVRQLAAEPLVTLGSHSLSHPRLSQLPEAEALAELRDSRQRLQAETGQPIKHLAYPYGGPAACGLREAAFANAAGYQTAATTRRGNLFAAHQHQLLALPRRRLVEGAESLLHLQRSLHGSAWLLHRGPRLAGMTS